MNLTNTRFATEAQENIELEAMRADPIAYINGSSDEELKVLFFKLSVMGHKNIQPGFILMELHARANKRLSDETNVRAFSLMRISILMSIIVPTLQVIVGYCIK